MEDRSCLYCNSKVELKDSDVIYGKSYGLVYICSKFPKCDSYVGVHRGTTFPYEQLQCMVLNLGLGLYRKFT